MWNILIETFDNSYKAELCSMLTASFDDVILYSNNGTTAFPDSEKMDIIIFDSDLASKFSCHENIEHYRKSGFTGMIVMTGTPSLHSSDSSLTSILSLFPYGISCFIEKPIARHKLISSISSLFETLEQKRAVSGNTKKIHQLARKEMLRELLIGHVDFPDSAYETFGLQDDLYQVVISESYNSIIPNNSFSLHDILSVASVDDVDEIDNINSFGRKIIILRGTSAQNRFANFLSHYKNGELQKGSPLDNLFIAFGEIVRTPRDIYKSYVEAEKLISRRFFCESGQHILSFEELINFNPNNTNIEQGDLNNFCSQITNYLQSFNRRTLSNVQNELTDYLSGLNVKITRIKFFIADLYLQIKENITRTYSNISISFPSNSEIISAIYSFDYMYQINKFLLEQYEMIMSSIGNSSRESVFDDILYYIDHNHQNNIKLETIASIFGYNSAYLGKIFSKTLGENFNTYIDKIRINHAKELLIEDKYKVYEIAEQVGYKNVDYFHKKFKKYVGVSPAEYRKSLESENVTSGEFDAAVISDDYADLDSISISNAS